MLPWKPNRTIEQALIAKLGHKAYGALLDRMMALANSAYRPVQRV